MTIASREESKKGSPVMPSIQAVVRAVRTRLPLAPTDPGVLPVLVVLVLFVIWLTATGENLLHAVAAALVLCLAASRATRTSKTAQA